MFTIAGLQAAYRDGRLTPVQALRDCLARLAAHDDPALFLALRDPAELLAEAEALQARGPAGLPLYGIPVAVKDNIDVAGLPTTAACPDFAYLPARDATAVARLRAAGALILGKTNLDQFATGLVGTRSPYGVPRNPLKADLIPGGSSSGSAAAVAAGIVPLALGTDTAGSGRVPAMLTNIVGLKPSLGLVSTAGVVPACRTLDCVSIFALTVTDAWIALSVLAGPDPADPFSRAVPLTPPDTPPVPAQRLGVLRPESREFFGDRSSAAGYQSALDRLAAMGHQLVPFDFLPFAETARLLYQGPWVAERWSVVEALARRNPDALHPITRAIIEQGAHPSALDAFRALYRLQELRQAVAPILAGLDALVLPTAPSPFRLAAVEADNIGLNSRLGIYTNFVNLLDLCGLALPATLAPDRTPFGITLLATAGRDGALAALGHAFQATGALPLGATGQAWSPALRPPTDCPGCPPRPTTERIPVAVFGAHMAGLPLNGELRALGGRFECAATTAPDYRLYLLPGTAPQRPGLLRVVSGGAPIAAEIWSLPPDGLGRLMASIAAPLGIGTVAMADGNHVKGFIVEAAGITQARDITELGGWRAFLAAEAAKPALAAAPG